MWFPILVSAETTIAQTTLLNFPSDSSLGSLTLTQNSDIGAQNLYTRDSMYFQYPAGAAFPTVREMRGVPKEIGVYRISSTDNFIRGFFTRYRNAAGGLETYYIAGDETDAEDTNYDERVLTMPQGDVSSVSGFNYSAQSNGRLTGIQF